MTFKTRRIAASDRIRNQIDLKLVDEKGRAIGLLLIRREVDMIDISDENPNGYWNIAPGRYVEYSVQPTRNGITYGATQISKRIDPAKADVAIAKALDASMKRYVKKYGVQNSGFKAQNRR
jgi:hypothetical protein